MILTITLILAFLVAVNFLLLFFSCNKITREKSVRKPKIIKGNNPKVIANQLPSRQLAATGS
jgi:hypothetical protein